MACITPGTQKKIVNMMFSTNEPILPVVSMATGGQIKHKKYRIIICLIFSLTTNIGDCYRFFYLTDQLNQPINLINPINYL